MHTDRGADHRRISSGLRQGPNPPMRVQGPRNKPARQLQAPSSHTCQSVMGDSGYDDTGATKARVSVRGSVGPESAVLAPRSAQARRAAGRRRVGNGACHANEQRCGVVGRQQGGGVCDVQQQFTCSPVQQRAQPWRPPVQQQRQKQLSSARRPPPASSAPARGGRGTQRYQGR